VYRSNLDTWFQDPGQRREISDAISGVAPVYVDITPSDPPVINGPLFAGDVSVCGTSTEPNGASIRVYVDLVDVGVGQVSGGTWCITVPSLFAGQNVNATAESAGEVESELSATVTVAAVGSVTACNDGVDNDGDGAVDFPDDPGCSSALDSDETDIPQCGDGIDNDGDGAVDYPNDPGCSSYVDNDESGLPACGDGVDNDGDGATDFPADPGCTSDTDVNEADIAQCANGEDDDGDGASDYPSDPGCSSAADDDEGDDPNTGGGDGGPGTGADGGSGGSGGTPDAGPGTSPGPIPDPGGVDEPMPDQGCCSAAGQLPSGSELFAGLLIAAVLLRRRRDYRYAYAPTKGREP